MPKNVYLLTLYSTLVFDDPVPFQQGTCKQLSPQELFILHACAKGKTIRFVFHTATLHAEALSIHIIIMIIPRISLDHPLFLTGHVGWLPSQAVYSPTEDCWKDVSVHSGPQALWYLQGVADSAAAELPCWAALLPCGLLWWCTAGQPGLDQGRDGWSSQWSVGNFRIAMYILGIIHNVMYMYMVKWLIRSKA